MCRAGRIRTHPAQHRVTSIVTSETHRLPQETGRAVPPPASGFAASCQRGLCPWPAWTAQAWQRVSVAMFTVKTHGVLRPDGDFRLSYREAGVRAYDLAFPWDSLLSHVLSCLSHFIQWPRGRGNGELAPRWPWSRVPGARGGRARGHGTQPPCSSSGWALLLFHVWGH